jgi:hypothetical protein
VPLCCRVVGFRDDVVKLWCCVVVVGVKGDVGSNVNMKAVGQYK